MRRLTNCLFLIVLIAGPRFASAGGDEAKESTLIEFKIKDQFKKEYTDAQFRGVPLCVLIANKGGSAFSRVWSPAIRDSLDVMGLGGAVNVLGVADMRGVPFFLKGLVRGKLPKEPDKWMLVDWKGKFAKAYHCVKDSCNILLFDDDASLAREFVVAELNEAAMSPVLAGLNELVGPADVEPLSPSDTSSTEDGPPDTVDDLN